MIDRLARGRLAAIIVKELLAMLRDPSARLSLVLPPLLQLFLFGFAATLEVKNIDVGVLDRDGGAYSQELIQRVAGSPNVRHVVRLRSQAELRDAIDDQRVIAALHFAPDFSADIAARRPATVQAIYDGRKSNAAQIVNGYVERIAGEYGAELRPQARGGGQTVVTHWFNPNLTYMWFTMPGLIVVIGAVSAMAVVAQSVAREREMGTFDQLMVSPLRVHEILIGKMFAPMMVGFANATLYVILIPILFRVPLVGSIPLLYLSLTFYLLALTGMGMLVSTLSHTQQQAFLGMFLITVPATMLSGFASPVDNMPGWLQLLAQANPPTHFLPIAEGIFLKGISAAEVLHRTVPLMIIAALSLAASSYFFRSRME